MIGWALVLAASLTLQADSTEIRIGDRRVDGSRLHEGRLTRSIVLTGMGAPRDAGVVTASLERTTAGNRPAMLAVNAFTGGAVDSLWFDPRTLRPMRIRSHTPARVLSLDFAGHHVTGRREPPETALTLIDQQIPVPPFAADMIDVLVASLPLVRGFTARVPVYESQAEALAWYTVRVSDMELVNGEGGRTSPAWLVHVDTPRRKLRYWVARDSRRILRSEYDLGRGMVLTIGVK